jgi:large subunit ribosomal protein L25
MTIGDSLRISDLAVPESVKLLDDPESVVATVTPPTRVEEPEEVEEEVEGEEVEGEGEAAPEGEGESGGDETAEA